MTGTVKSCRLRIPTERAGFVGRSVRKRSSRKRRAAERLAVASSLLLRRDLELGAATSIDPDSTRIDPPCRASQAGCSAQLPDEVDPTTGIRRTKGAPVISRLAAESSGIDRRGRGRRRRGEEVRSAPVVHPDASRVPAPALASSASFAAQSTRQLDTARGVGGAVSPLLGDGLAADGGPFPWPHLRWLDDEVGPAPVIHPDVSGLDPPVGTESARGSAQLPGDANARAARGRAARVPLVDRFAPKRMLGGGVSRCGQDEGEDAAEKAATDAVRRRGNRSEIIMTPRTLERRVGSATESGGVRDGQQRHDEGSMLVASTVVRRPGAGSCGGRI